MQHTSHLTCLASCWRLLLCVLCRLRKLQQTSTGFPYIPTTWEPILTSYPLTLGYASGGGSSVCFALTLQAGTTLSGLCVSQQGWGLYSATIIGMGLQVGECATAARRMQSRSVRDELPCMCVYVHWPNLGMHVDARCAVNPAVLCRQQHSGSTSSRQCCLMRDAHF